MGNIVVMSSKQAQRADLSSTLSIVAGRRRPETAAVMGIGQDRPKSQETARMGRTAPFPAVHGKQRERCSSQTEKHLCASKVAGAGRERAMAEPKPDLIGDARLRLGFFPQPMRIEAHKTWLGRESAGGQCVFQSRSNMVALKAVRTGKRSSGNLVGKVARLPWSMSLTRAKLNCEPLSRVQCPHRETPASKP